MTSNPAAQLGLAVPPSEAGVELRFGSQIQMGHEAVVVRVGALWRHEQEPARMRHGIGVPQLTIAAQGE